MEAVTSPDGTRIAYHRSQGSGSPLILIPGTGAANPVAWTSVLPALQEHFRVCAVDRRGHGASGDHPAYAIEREYEDVAAVVDSHGVPAFLLGHSFGGLIALEAALLTRNVSRLILYEPVLGGPLYPETLLARFQTLHDEGDRDGLLTLHYRENVGMQPEEIAQFRSSPAWPDRLATALTLPREMQAEDRYRFDPRRFRDLRTPTLLLQGSDSPELLKASTRMLQAALPVSRIAVLEGQQHLAMYTAPDLFLQAVLAFLLEPGSPGEQEHPDTGSA